MKFRRAYYVLHINRNFPTYLVRAMNGNKHSYVAVHLFSSPYLSVHTKRLYFAWKLDTDGQSLYLIRWVLKY